MRVFREQLRGYDKSEVHAAINELHDQLEKAQRDLWQKDQTIKELSLTLERYENRQVFLGEVLTEAELAPSRQLDQQKAEAKKAVTGLLADAEERLQTAFETIDRLESLSQAYEVYEQSLKDDLMAVLTSHMDQLKGPDWPLSDRRIPQALAGELSDLRLELELSQAIISYPKKHE